jgi:hypothetical protein
MDSCSGFRRSTFAGLLALSAVFLTSPARAANLEPAGINLGGTSFMDGFGRNEGGFTYMAYLQYVMGRAINGSLQAAGDDSKPLPVFNDPKIDIVVLLNQLVYTVPTGLFGNRAHFAFDFLLPVVWINTSFSPPPPFPGTSLTGNGIGLGDFTFGPLLQFKPLLTASGRPVFSTRIEFDVIAPVGKYNPRIDINQSSNFVSLVPYWAMTVLPTAHWEISARLHYLYNFKNERPAIGRLYGLQNPPPIANAQAGQATWVNFATSYDVYKGFSIGLNGYYFHQFNLDRWEWLNGTSYPGLMYNDSGKLRILAGGGGAMWAPAEMHDKITFNYYHQFWVENGLKSDVFNLRWLHAFP